MESPSSDRRHAVLKAASRAAAVLAAALGAAGLAGWLLDLPALQSFRPDWPSMRPNTAVGLVCAGAAAVALAPPAARGARRAGGLGAAVLVLAIGVLTLVQWALDSDLGADALLAFIHPVPALPNGALGRPAALSGIGFMLTGGALLALGARRRWADALASWLAIALGLVAYVVLVGYAHGVVFHIVPASVGMAATTAMAFLALAVSAMLARPDRGLVAEITADAAGGILARRLVFAALVGPPVLGLAAVRALRAGWLADEEAFALLASATAAGATASLLLATRSLNRAEAERRRGEAARARLAALVTSSGDAIIAKTPEGIVTDWNAAAEAMLGWEASEILGCSIDRIIPADRRAEHDELMARIRRGEPVASHQTVRLHKRGELIDVALTASPILGEDGRIIGISSISRDIRRLKQLERLREEWTAVIAHDLRQPLGVVKFAARMLEIGRATRALDERESKAIARIVTAADRLDRMIDDLLDASRIEAHQLVLQRVDVDAARLVRDIVDRVGETLAGRRVRVRVDGAPRTVSVDPARIEQVVANLVSNAVKYGSPAASIDVLVSGTDGEATILVTNRGRGLTREERERLFTRFYRVRPESAEGVGLGLYIAKGIVEAHGGRIWVDSVPDETTTFSFTLPSVVMPATIVERGVA